MNKTNFMLVVPMTSVWLLSSYNVDAVSTPEPLKLSTQSESVQLQSYKISQNQNNLRDTSTLEKALQGRWVSEPLISGKDTRLTYYFSTPNIWLTGQELDGKQVSGEQLRFKVIKVNEKENSLRIKYGLPGAPEALDGEATVVFTLDRQGLVVIFHANGIDVPSLKPFKYAGSQPQP